VSLARTQLREQLVDTETRLQRSYTATAAAAAASTERSASASSELTAVLQRERDLQLRVTEAEASAFAYQLLHTIHRTHAVSSCKFVYRKVDTKAERLQITESSCLAAMSLVVHVMSVVV
jgi:hypothetical protein